MRQILNYVTFLFGLTAAVNNSLPPILAFFLPLITIYSKLDLELDSGNIVSGVAFVPIPRVKFKQPDNPEFWNLGCADN